MGFTYLIGSSTAGSTGGATTGSAVSFRKRGAGSTVYAWGTWNSSVLKLQVLPAAGTTSAPWNDIAGSTMTADGLVSFTVEANQIRATHTAGSTAGTTALRVGLQEAD